MSEQLHKGDHVFMSTVIVDEQDRPQDVTILEGTLLEVIEGDRWRVKVSSSEGDQVLTIPRHQLYLDRETAERRKFAAIAWLQRKTLKESVEGHVGFLPDQIAQRSSVHFTDNPLRYGEQKMAFAAYTNTWGKANSIQKQLQMINAIWEDIRSLSDILLVLSYANDYTKKLIGKYIIIELKSLFDCLTNLSKLDKNYQQGLYQRLLRDRDTLEDQFKFKVIRNKIGAHRDTNLNLIEMVGFWKNISRYNISKYIELFSSHLQELSQLYPGDLSLIPSQAVVGIVDVGIPEGHPYQPFDEPFDALEVED